MLAVKNKISRVIICHVNSIIVNYMNKKFLAYVSVIVGILFLVAAYIYWSHAAGQLPTYFPGYESASTKIHFKHGLGSAILALALFAFAWFTSGKKSPEQN